MNKLFELRGDLPQRTRLILEISGFGLLFLLWYMLTIPPEPAIPPGILPSPLVVWQAIISMFNENRLINNILRSIGLNLTGYVVAILISVFAGFLIGLLPFFRGLLSRQIEAFRFVPLTGVIGLFILWFGLQIELKVYFLAFGILIYMLPVIITRIDEVNDVYLKTAYTLGASKWDTFKTVYFPHVMSKFSDDIRVLTAISWTYIIIIENYGSTGGLGAVMWQAGIRQGSMSKLFGLLFIIIIIGFIQDKFFKWLDKEIFPHKYAIETQKQSGKLAQQSAVSKFFASAASLFKISVAVVLLALVLNELLGFLGRDTLLYEAFGATYWVVACLFTIFSVWILYRYINTKQIVAAPKSN